MRIGGDGPPLHVSARCGRSDCPGLFVPPEFLPRPTRYRVRIVVPVVGLADRRVEIETGLPLCDLCAPKAPHQVQEILDAFRVVYDVAKRFQVPAGFSPSESLARVELVPVFGGGS